MAFELDTILYTWDATWEQDKADFLEELYEYYSPENNCYTGLFIQYQKDLAEFIRDWNRLDPSDMRFGKPWLFPVPTAI
jgi:hypothetical protein